MKTSLKWYCESSTLVYFLRQYTFRDTKITFQLLFIPVLFMCDSSLRTHPSLLLIYYYYYYYIIINKRRDEQNENVTQVQAVMSVRDLRNPAHVTLAVTLPR